MNIIKHRNIFFIISALVIIPGIISLLTVGLKLGIDFTGGSRLELGFNQNIKGDEIRKIVESQKIQVHNVRISEGNSLTVTTTPISQKQKTSLIEQIRKSYKSVKEKSFDTVGPTIGSETTIKAIQAVLLASVAITLYIAFAFREVSRPLSSWKYGVAAIGALLHDVLLVIGAFSILGHFSGVEIDSLFITAVLTVMGFSVHDTIVVFDRIRENLKKGQNISFDETVNTSVLETFNRSLNTSLTVVIVLFALILFGGESIRWFVVALLIGIVSGTYSSIFNASPLLVVWNNWDRKRKSEK